MPRLSWFVKLYENLTYVHMRPVAIALNYSVKGIRNDVRQIIEQTSVGLAPITCTAVYHSLPYQ